MKPDTYTINLLKPVLVAFALYVGITGRVSWWVIGLVFMSECSANITLKRR